MHKEFAPRPGLSLSHLLAAIQGNTWIAIDESTETDTPVSSTLTDLISVLFTRWCLYKTRYRLFVEAPGDPDALHQAVGDVITPGYRKHWGHERGGDLVTIVGPGEATPLLMERWLLATRGEEEHVVILAGNPNNRVRVPHPLPFEGLDWIELWSLKDWIESDYNGALNWDKRLEAWTRTSKSPHD